MYTIDSDYKHIETEESTAICKENDVYQYHYDSPPIEDHFLRLQNHERIEVRKVLNEGDDCVEFLDKSNIKYVWKRS